MTKEITGYGGSPYQIYKSPNSHIKMPKISIPTYKVGDRVQERSKTRTDRSFATNFKKNKLYRAYLSNVRKGTILEVFQEKNKIGKTYWHYLIKFDDIPNPVKKVQGLLELEN